MAAAKATFVIQSIRRSLNLFDLKSFIILEKMYVRPHLKYCKQAWSPYLVKNTEHLEKKKKYGAEPLGW